MKGLLLLSEMRCGSSWLASLTNSTKKLGNSSEWLHPNQQDPYKTFSGEAHFKAILARSRSDNDRFSVKIFPFHLYTIRTNFGYDFIDRCRQEHEIEIVLLDRIDRLGAAISATRALQTGNWMVFSDESRNKAAARTEEAYDREYIQSNINKIGESLEFWKQYLCVRGLTYHPVFYEDVLADWQAYVKLNADLLEVKIDLGDASPDIIRIQRDATTEEWRSRFESGPRDEDALYSDLRDRYPRTPRNLLRLLTKKKLIRTKTGDYFDF